MGILDPGYLLAPDSLIGGCYAAKSGSNSWFVHFVCPLLCRWKTVERLTIASRAEQNSFQTQEMNCGPQSETMSSGMP